MRNLKNIRLPNYDYQLNGWYFVTINSNWRRKYFLGNERLVVDELLQTANNIVGVTINAYVIMPDHVHCIIVLQDSTISLGEVVRRFKAKVSHVFMSMPGSQTIMNELSVTRLNFLR